MGTVVVVVANPAVESFKPGTVAGVELGVGPLAQHRLDESLGLAVGLGLRRRMSLCLAPT